MVHMNLKIAGAQTIIMHVFQLGIVTLLDIVKQHASAMSREDLDKVQDALWMLYCQHFINIRNDCKQVGITFRFILRRIHTRVHLKGPRAAHCCS
jgi:hypothetical protein